MTMQKALGSKKVEVWVHPTMYHLLIFLTETGVFGHSIAETIRQILGTYMRAIIKSGLLKDIKELSDG